MNITVIICAYTADRWDDILEAIASVRAQQQPVLEIILVVDHNDALYARSTAALPDVVVLKNQQARGLSGGRCAILARRSRVQAAPFSAVGKSASV